MRLFVYICMCLANLLKKSDKEIYYFKGSFHKIYSAFKYTLNIKAINNS